MSARPPEDPSSLSSYERGYAWGQKCAREAFEGFFLSAPASSDRRQPDLEALSVHGPIVFRAATAILTFRLRAGWLLVVHHGADPAVGAVNPRTWRARPLPTNYAEVAGQVRAGALTYEVKDATAVTALLATYPDDEPPLARPFRRRPLRVVRGDKAGRPAMRRNDERGPHAPRSA